MKNKILKSLGAFLAVVAPTAIMVSCSENESKSKKDDWKDLSIEGIKENNYQKIYPFGEFEYPINFENKMRNKNYGYAYHTYIKGNLIKINLGINFEYRLKINKDSVNNVFYVADIRNLHYSNEKELINKIKDFLRNNGPTFLDLELNDINNLNRSNPSDTPSVVMFSMEKKYLSFYTDNNNFDSLYPKQEKEMESLKKQLENLNELKFIKAIANNAIDKIKKVDFSIKIKKYLEKNITNFTKVIFRDPSKTILESNVLKEIQLKLKN